MFQDVKACMAFPKHSETWDFRDVDFRQRLQGVSLVCFVYHSFHRFISFCLHGSNILLLWKYILDMRLRHGFHLHVMLWTFFLNLVFSLKPWPLVVYLYAK